MLHGQDLLAVPGCERLALADAEISLWRQPDLGQSSAALLEQLIRSTEWRQERITVYGKAYLQPRLSAWYGDLSYAYSGINMQARPWTPLLSEIRTGIEALLGHRFNSVLLNYYRDENDSMGMHSDNESELGQQPLIASLSLGDERVFLLRHRTRKDLKTIKLPLPSGSLLVMAGKTQSHWRHGIARERLPCGPRVNLTFRRVIPDAGSTN